MNREELILRFQQTFQTQEEPDLFFAPGRVEIIGNHCDHQNGRVIAAAVNVSIYGAAMKCTGDYVYLASEGFAPITVSLRDTGAGKQPKGSPEALLCGVLDQMKQQGKNISGFCLYVSSEIPVGSGLSSSAAFANLIGTVANHLFCGHAYTPAELAQLSQTAENRYFGKPCGRMDQMASALGGMMIMDFSDPEQPKVEKLAFDSEECPYHMVIVQTPSSHADLTEAYASIRDDMEAVAALLGKRVLGETDITGFYEKIDEIRMLLGDLPVMRAEHFYAENQRVLVQKEMITQKNWQAFAALEKASGNSSWYKLRNIVARGSGNVVLGMALLCTERYLNGEGACRVHGGGFAGTLLAFVPKAKTAEYMLFMEQFLGENCCRILSVEERGAGKME